MNFHHQPLAAGLAGASSSSSLLSSELDSSFLAGALTTGATKNERHYTENNKYFIYCNLR